MRHNSTRTLLFGVFVLAGRRLTASQVIALAKPLGISPTNVKSHLTRMVAEGGLRRSGPARRALYWPSPLQANVVQGINVRLATPPAEPWDRTWLLLTLRMPLNRSHRERLRASLWFDGFRPWAPGTFARPTWPEQWARGRSRHYLARAPGLCVRGTLVGSVSPSVVGAMYALDALDREARRLARSIRNKRIPNSLAAAFAARLTVGGLVAHLVGHDPRLPPALWGGRTGLRDLVRAFHRFEARIGPLGQRFLNEGLAGSGRHRSG